MLAARPRIVERPRAQRKVPIEFLKPNPRNPRRAFSDVELGELSDSIKQHGVIQPIVVRPVKGAQDRYEIIAGERRWRASQMAGLHEVPIVPVEVSDAVALEFAIIENVQREDLNAMEEAQGYYALANDFKRSQDEIAKLVGKSRSHVANMMRLTKLPDDVQALYRIGRFIRGTCARADRRARCQRRGKRIVAEGLNVRQAEALAHDEGVPERKPQKARARLRRKRSRHDRSGKTGQRRARSQVTVDHRDPGGTVQIKYRDLDQLDEILRRLDEGGETFQPPSSRASE